ncbi:hypothetical protein B6U74_01185 [Candidatus Bathyarchaeota archaeon ex4484_205]|nr:MAG: hypothetical protein B6U74_01185 [Candidatus Bathyarchaeota archaeon ex4484_205]
MSSEAASKVTTAAEKVGLTKRILILGLIIELIFLLNTPGFGLNSQHLILSYPRQPNPITQPSVILFIVTILAYLLAKAGVMSMFTPQELIVLYGMVGATALVMSPGEFGWGNYWGFFMSIVVNDQAAANFGKVSRIDWVLPSKSAFDYGMYGGVGVPWGEWIVPILGMIFFAGSTIILSYSIVLIMRRRWIEEERWVFPFARLATETVYIAEMYPELKKGKRKIYPLLIGFIIGVLLGIPMVINTYAPALLPELPPILQPHHLDPRDDLLWYEGWWNEGINIAFNWYYVIWFVCIGLLIPLDVLNTAAIFEIFFYVILLPLLTLAGLLPYWDWRDSYNMYWSFATGDGWPWTQGGWNPLMPGLVFDVGGLLGLGLVSIWLARGYIARTLKALTSGESIPGEENEPVPYKYAWLMFIVGSILMLIVYMAGFGAPVHVAITALIVMWIIVVAGARMRGEAGLGGFFFWYENTRGLWAELWGFTGWYQGPIDSVDVITPEFYAAEHVYYWTMVHNTSFQNGYNAIALDTYKAGFEVGVSPKDIFKATVIGTVIALLLTMPIMLMRSYKVGLSTGPGWGPAPPAAISGPNNFWMDPSYWMTFPPTSAIGAPTPWIHVIAGIIIMFGVVYARMRWVWFPISPAGLILANSGILIPWGGFTTTIVIPWIIKLIIYKTVGAKFFEERVQPLAVGYLVGYFLMYIILTNPVDAMSWMWT